MSIEKVYHPKCVPEDWRILKLTEPAEVGDFYWSKKVGYWLQIKDVDNEFPRFLPVIRRENPLPTENEYIRLLYDVSKGKVTGTFAGIPELKEAFRYAFLVLDEVPLFVEMAIGGCVSGHFNEWDQLRPGCRHVAEALSLRQGTTKRDAGRSPISASLCGLPRRSGSS
jgi:hypothetical protein